ncbi:MAG: peptide chain release factor N(5)-glutamine methyltransferase [Clostridia bacterium]|nr:peptide chain release factor N(5)-glutamine methyltransferase [Clostridia bacterium]
MKTIELRKQIKSEFDELGIEKEDADFIIAEVLGLERTELFMIQELDDGQVETIMEMVEKRKSGIPVDKIFHKSYFFGLELEVNEDVLSPRQDSEILVETAIKYIKEREYKTALDMCTGSGCLAISIKKHTDIDMTAVDVSQKAITIAKRNARQNEVDINFIRSNMFEKVEGKFDIIVSNPPYISTDELPLLDREVVEHDPILALDGGPMGLKYYNIIHDNLRNVLNDGGVLILEIGDDQKLLLMSLFNDFNCIGCLQDLSSNDRVLIFEK